MRVATLVALVLVAALVTGSRAEGARKVSGTIDQLFDAIRAHDLAKVDALISAHPSVLAERNAQGVSPLSWAAYLGQQPIVEALRVKRGAPDFYEACIVGDEGAVRAALAAGQDVNAFAPDGFTPIGLGAFFRHPEIVKLLADAGADLNLRSRNAQKVGPLHAAAARNDVQTLELLLVRGADANLPQEKLARPLHSAASNGSTVAVALLLMYGADPSAATEDGERAADIARKKGHAALAARLEGIAAGQRKAGGD
jgi:uncharacterized protein